MKNALPFLALALLSTACVSSQKYRLKDAEAQSQRQRADALDAKASQLSKDLDAAKQAQDDLNAKLKADADQLASLQTQLTVSSETIAGLEMSNGDLTSSLAANKSQLSQKVAGLIKERDEVSQKLSAAEAQVATLTQQLSDAQAARKALEDAKAAELEQVKKSYEDLTSGLKSEIAAGQVQITQLKGKLTVNMVDQILFDSGRAEIKADGQKVLEKIGGLLNQVQDKDISIEGHTDNKPIAPALQAKYPTNWELSTARATAVARYLEDHAGVDPKRLVAAGYGEYRPKASNDTPEGRAQNRRIEIILVPKE